MATNTSLFDKGDAMKISSESGSQLLARLMQKQPIPVSLNHLWPQYPCSVSDVIEIFGPSGSGKTQLLLDCIVSALLHDSTCQVWLFDTQQHITANRILTMLESAGHKDPNSALGRLMVAAPTSIGQLMVTIETLMTSPTVPSLLAIDSLSTLYWSDRLWEKATGTRLDTLYNAMARRLLHLARSRHVLIVCTRHPLTQSDNGQRASLTGSEWASVVSRRVLTSVAECDNNGACSKFMARGIVPAHRCNSQLPFVVDDTGVRWLTDSNNS